MNKGGRFYGQTAAPTPPTKADVNLEEARRELREAAREFGASLLRASSEVGYAYGYSAEVAEALERAAEEYVAAKLRAGK